MLLVEGHEEIAAEGWSEPISRMAMINLVASLSMGRSADRTAPSTIRHIARSPSAMPPFCWFWQSRYRGEAHEGANLRTEGA